MQASCLGTNNHERSSKFSPRGRRELSLHAGRVRLFRHPLLWLLSLAVRDKREIYLGVARFIPNHPTLDNFVNVLTNSAFPTYLWNGLKLASLSAAGVLIVALPAAYAFSRFDFRTKGLWMLALLSFQMISPLVIMVPLYRYMSWFGLIDTHFGAVAVYVALGCPLACWLLKGSIDAIPRALDEAAMMDGCSRFSLFWRIILPLAVPGVASVFIISVIAGWSQFLIPFLLLTKTSLMPIAVGIFTFQGLESSTSTPAARGSLLDLRSTGDRRLPAASTVDPKRNDVRGREGMTKHTLIPLVHEPIDLTGSNSEQAGEHNRALVLRAIHRHAPISRADLRQAYGADQARNRTVSWIACSTKG